MKTNIGKNIDPYKLLSKYYDMCKGSFTNDLPLYFSVVEKDTKILEIGCGTGRILEVFLKKGYKISGTDISEEMLSVARQKLSSYFPERKLNLFNHNYITHPTKEKYDYILLSFYVFNYILSDDDQTIFLKIAYSS